MRAIIKRRRFAKNRPMCHDGSKPSSTTYRSIDKSSQRFLYKPRWLLFSLVAVICTAMVTPSYAAINLEGVYRQAVNNDQELKISLAELRQKAEGVPQAWADILPDIEATGTGTLSHTDRNVNGTVGDSSIATTSETVRGFDYGITLDQTLFNMSDFRDIQVANRNLKAQYAQFKADQQDLISRTIDAYLDVLEAEDVVAYAEAEERALLEQYRQADESFKVGVKTITDVYQAKAAYDGAVSKTITEKNDLANAYEALSVITGQVYKKLTPLSEQFPLVSPDPANINKWVEWTNSNNATIAYYYYLAQADKYDIKSKWGGHIPTLDSELAHNGAINHSITRVGNSTIRSHGPSLSLTLTVPIFQGGLVNSEVREAVAAYKEAEATLELNRREEVEDARKAYLAVVSGVSQIKADRRTIISDKSALDATIESYKVGTRTIVDVLDAEQQLYEDLSTYAQDRYTYVEAIISLKQAAGTLNSSDIIKLNSWMYFPKDNKTALDKLNEYMKNNSPRVDPSSPEGATRPQPVSPVAQQIQRDRGDQVN